MIEPKQAVQFALQNLFELLGTRELANDVEGIQLEELELTDDSKDWDVTLSCPVKKPQNDDAATELPPSLARFIGTPRRKWMTLRIDSKDGKLIRMKLAGQQAVGQLAT